MLNRLRARPRGDDGITLPELLVSLLIMSMVMIMAVTAVVSGLRASANAQLRTRALADLQQAVQRSAMHVRAANPLVTATASSLTANEVRGSTTFYVSLSIVDSATASDGKVLRYAEWVCAVPPCLSQPAGSGTSKEWLTGLVTPTGTVTSWFRYSWINSSGAVAEGTPASADDLGRVYAARISLRRTVPKLSPIQSATAVALRNSTSSTG